MPSHRALTLFIAVLLARSVFGADASCFSEGEREPAEGKWQGSFQLSYKMQYPAAVPPMTIRWEGDLDFVLAHDTENGISFPLSGQGEWVIPNCMRAPLGAPPLPGCDKNGNPISRQYVPPKVSLVPAAGRPRFSGIANAAMHFDFAMSGRGATAIESLAKSEKPAQLDTKEELEGGERIQAVLLMGSPKQFSFLSNFSGRDSSTSVRENARLSGTGEMSANATARSRDGSRGTESIRTDGSGKADVHMEGTTADGHRYERDSSMPAPSAAPDEWKRMFRLVVEERDCWLMKGKLDTSEIARSVQSSGMRVEIGQSEWSVTLKDRDLAFEREVDRIAQERIPSPLTWDYVNRLLADFSRLRGDKPSDYRLCVLRKAKDKIGVVFESGLRELVADYPRVDQGATGPVLCAAEERVLPLVRFVQLMVADCPLQQEAMQKIYEQHQALADKLGLQVSALTCSSR